MRDRSGFDLDGKGQIDRDPIGFEPGLSLAYTDEAHGYGNAGTDDPPAQSPLDSRAGAGREHARTSTTRRSPTAAAGRRSPTPAPATPTTTPTPARTSGNWAFGYDCLGFDVTSLTGEDDGAGDLRR